MIKEFAYGIYDSAPSFQRNIFGRPACIELGKSLRPCAGNAAVEFAIAARSSKDTKSEGSWLVSTAVTSIVAVTAVIAVRAHICRDFSVTSGVTSGVAGVTARPSNRAKSASRLMAGHQLFGVDFVNPRQPAADASRLGAFPVAVGLG
jgi:hypothetical protein